MDIKLKGEVAWLSLLGIQGQTPLISLSKYPNVTSYKQGLQLNWLCITYHMQHNFLREHMHMSSPNWIVKVLHVPRTY